MQQIVKWTLLYPQSSNLQDYFGPLFVNYSLRLFGIGAVVPL